MRLSFRRGYCRLDPVVHGRQHNNFSHYRSAFRAPKTFHSFERVGVPDLVVMGMSKEGVLCFLFATVPSPVLQAYFKDIKTCVPPIRSVRVKIRGTHQGPRYMLSVCDFRDNRRLTSLQRKSSTCLTA